MYYLAERSAALGIEAEILFLPLYFGKKRLQRKARPRLYFAGQRPSSFSNKMKYFKIDVLKMIARFVCILSCCLILAIFKDDYLNNIAATNRHFLFL